MVAVAVDVVDVVSTAVADRCQCCLRQSLFMLQKLGIAAVFVVNFRFCLVPPPL